MAEPTKNRKEWRMSRRCAGMVRRSYMLGRTPIKRLCFLMSEGYGIYSMGLCYPSGKAQSRRQKSACGALHDCCVAGGE